MIGCDWSSDVCSSDLDSGAVVESSTTEESTTAPESSTTEESTTVPESSTTEEDRKSVV